MGAGSILEAHTDHEHVVLKDLEQVAARHVQTVQSLLSTPIAQ